MIQDSSPSVASIRSVAVPTEHGGWAFLLQPISLGLLVQPSLPGALLGLAALFAFLSRHPMKLALGDRRKGKRYRRTALAERLALGYALLAVLSFVPALALARAPFWIPLILAVPLALVQQYYDVRKRSREWAAEVAGALALGGLAPAVGLAGGMDTTPALALWPLLAAQSVPAILYARARLRLERDTQTSKPKPGVPVSPATVETSARQSARRRTVWLAHGVGLVIAIGLAGLNVAPWLGSVAMAVMLARAVHGLSSYRRPASAMQVGIQEVLFSALTVILIATGVRIDV